MSLDPFPALGIVRPPDRPKGGNLAPMVKTQIEQALNEQLYHNFNREQRDGNTTEGGLT